jgi:hypothetical protein
MQKNEQGRQEYEEVDLDQFEFDDLLFENDNKSDNSGNGDVIFDQRELDELGLGDLSTRH